MWEEWRPSSKGGWGEEEGVREKGGGEGWSGKEGSEEGKERGSKR